MADGPFDWHNTPTSRFRTQRRHGLQMSMRCVRRWRLERVDDGGRMMDAQEYYRIVQKNIETAGQHVQEVGGDENTPPFLYTIGNHGKNLPEILLIGASGKAFWGILNDLGRIMRERGRAYENGELVDLGGSFPIKMIDVPATVNDKFALQAGRYYETEDYRVQQAVMCDTKGRYPGDKGCDPAYNAQVEHLRSGMN
jgi:hypothetical protein